MTSERRNVWRFYEQSVSRLPDPTPKPTLPFQVGAKVKLNGCPGPASGRDNVSPLTKCRRLV